jgi:hypothetical protein
MGVCDTLPQGTTIEQCQLFATTSNSINSIKDNITQTLASQLMTKDSPTYKSNEGGKLLKRYKDAQKKLKDAPQILSNAEKSYYVYNDGKPSGDEIYNSIIYDRFAKTADEFKQNSIEKQQQFMTELSQLLKQYQAEQLFAIHATNLLQERTKKLADLKKSLFKYENIIQNNERKVVYQLNDMDGLYLYRRVMLFIYYSAIVIYIVFGSFIPDKQYKKFSICVMLIIAALIPLILNRIIKWIFILKEYVGYWLEEIPHKDVLEDL